MMKLKTKMKFHFENQKILSEKKQKGLNENKRNIPAHETEQKVQYQNIERINLKRYQK